MESLCRFWRPLMKSLLSQQKPAGNSPFITYVFLWVGLIMCYWSFHSQSCPSSSCWKHQLDAATTMLHCRDGIGDGLVISGVSSKHDAWHSHQRLQSLSHQAREFVAHCLRVLLVLLTNSRRAAVWLVLEWFWSGHSTNRPHIMLQRWLSFW